jgi:dCMP deaminase
MIKNIEKYLNICDEIALFSKCLSRKIGVLIVTPDFTIVNSGYNGPPRLCPHCDSKERLDWLVERIQKEKVGDIRNFLLDNGFGKRCPRQIMGFRSGEGLSLCQAGHAEANAIANCSREGIGAKGNWIIMNCSLPCQECCKMIIGAGITKVICVDAPDYDLGSRWILNNAGVEIIQIKR